jgi:error-prone DNA polymerase
MFAELHCLTNFSFQRGASHAEELVNRAKELGYSALAITDECSMAGMVKAHVAAKEAGLKLIVGAEFRLSAEEGGEAHVVLLAPNKDAYTELCNLITRGRRRADKGRYELRLDDLYHCRNHALCIWLPTNASQTAVRGNLLAKPSEAGMPTSSVQGRIHSVFRKQVSSGCSPAPATNHQHQLDTINAWFKTRLWIGVELLQEHNDQQHYLYCHDLAEQFQLPMVACNDVHMHSSKRKPLQDLLTAIGHNTTVSALGSRRQRNAQRYLRPLEKLQAIYPQALLAETQVIADKCSFSMSELKYHYPKEVVPEDMVPIVYLRQLVSEGEKRRWPKGTPTHVSAMLQKELQLVQKLKYEHYFLTVYDIVQYARSQQILCQGRGSAANSAVCYCIGVTEVDPAESELLLERFISEERDEAPDIDVDFEHERREEVIQYVYRKYGRDRAALAATVITYRTRSAIRDVGKALGFDERVLEALSESHAWWEKLSEFRQRVHEIAGPADSRLVQLFFELVRQLMGFPRHLSQHVGGFIIADVPVWTLVPIENASMEDRTVVQWDKDDIEALGLLKVDVLALGMLTAIRKSADMIGAYLQRPFTMSDVVKEDPATYEMLQRGDSVGVFQVESRAQMSMLPRLRPHCFYDLVIQIAIVRPGPIQGDMVHPYLRRRNKEETWDDGKYPAIKSVLERTLGVPIFQEQAIKLAMVAADFTGGEADQLRRAMASWKRGGQLEKFREKLINGMLKNGYPEEFANRLYNQIEGFGGYGFPESHSASFALLAYVSAWLKRHHPAAFYCGLLNSQPMGFYSPSQLVQDARRHGIAVLPADIHYSHWEHRLVSEDDCTIPRTIRLGFCLVKNFNEEAAKRIEQARAKKPFASLYDLRRRARLNSIELDALAAADAFRPMAGHRHNAYWQSTSLPQYRPLLEQVDSAGADNEENIVAMADEIILAEPTEAQTVFADYASTGLTLNTHPMALLRDQSPFNICKSAVQLRDVTNHRFVRVAGIVTGRQRPGTATGVLFVTLEDETGNINVVVWKDVQERYKRELLTSKLLLIKGSAEKKNEVIHVIAGEIFDCGEAVDDLNTSSRDFH